MESSANPARSGAGRDSEPGFAAEIDWLVHAAGWSALGSAVDSYVFLLRCGVAFGDSDAPRRVHSWLELASDPFSLMFDRFGLAFMGGFALLALVCARILLRRRNLARCTLITAGCVAAYILVDLAVPGILGREGPGLIGCTVVLCSAMLACRLWPGRLLEIPTRT